MAQAGRKKKATIQREANGRAQRAGKVRETGELRARRLYLANGGDPALCSHPLGVLRVNGGCTMEQYRAGCRFAWLRGVVFGKATITAVAFERAEGFTTRRTDWDWLARIERQHDATLRHLRADLAAHDAVYDVVILEVTPRWMQPLPPVINDIAAAAALLRGLDRLSAYEAGDCAAARKRFDIAAPLGVCQK